MVHLWVAEVLAHVACAFSPTDVEDDKVQRNPTDKLLLRIALGRVSITWRIERAIECFLRRSSEKVV